MRLWQALRIVERKAADRKVKKGERLRRKKAERLGNIKQGNHEVEKAMPDQLVKRLVTKQPRRIKRRIRARRGSNSGH